MFNFLQSNDITYLEKILLDGNNNLKIVSYEKLKNIPQNDISLFCVKHGVYNIPTLELLDFIKNEINGKEESTIEIGAGNGVMAEQLGITATDSMQQNLPEIKALYKMAQQAPVTYGQNVCEYEALEAIKLLKPNIAIGAWITHKYNPLEHWREGNAMGIDESMVIKKVKKYIFIGNEGTHGNKPILDICHRTVKAEWLVSRSMNKEKNVIWIWEKDN